MVTGNDYGSDLSLADRLGFRIANLQTTLAEMRAVNDAWHRFGEQGLLELGWPAHRVRDTVRAIAEAPARDKRPFPAHALAAREALLRRLGSQLADLTGRATPGRGGATGGQEAVNGALLDVEPSSRRICLQFPGDVDPHTRVRLQRHGFRFVDALDAWSQPLSARAIKAARRVLAAWSGQDGLTAPLDGYYTKKYHK